MLRSILIIDDSESQQFLYKHTLEKALDGVTVHTAFDGVEALEVIDNLQNTIDCILLDINMPRMNGFEFLEEYCKRYHDEVRIVAMLTSSTQEIDKAKALAYPCVKDYFVKPMTSGNIQKLLDLVKGQVIS